MTPRAKRALLAMAEASDGRLTPSEVVDAARDPSSPLHDRFNWDDAEAAYLHRLDTARALIRDLKITVVVDRKAITVPAFVRNPDLPSDVSGYLSFQRVRSDEETSRAVILDEMKRAASALARARRLADALDQAPAIDEILVLIARTEKEFSRATKGRAN